MDFGYDLEQCIGSAADKMPVLKASDSAKARSKQVCYVIDEMGYASSKAQGLPGIITTADKFFSASSDQELILWVEGTLCKGLLKLGNKKLFIRSESGTIKEIQPTCVLDFYVHESCQRSGLGKKLFIKMLESKGVKPQNLAYDKPSPKLISFL